MTNQWQSRQRGALKPFGLTHVQFVILAAVGWLSKDSVVTQRTVVHFAHLDEAMTSQVVRALESRQLLRRTRSPTDGRAWELALTPAGGRLVNEAVVVVEKVDEEFFHRIASTRSLFLQQLRTLHLGTADESE
ncbi:MarR family winged helix-turn-helix transcriptional regulator [Paenarthrobacter sp. NPDC089675]|uniref:MarR family winged helix-turn-helix transcriptional regulator n=1 Tax=Paenarthrobacter sp. NPDC089675 TaxID=3364376 RepID=UPI00381BFF7B